ncbi:conserved hypothetical protein [Shewanella halifaxensis HAW-EB4]|uniref:Outer membrane protein beta-barrel domain-containing protein n=1 Tax=Shewanella halifaxensis (strain HAW-EB4) TaxID=458817 RepID=B0TV05_SHEHH|nr:hypothetical protein [Shewanella halifaxensis]ABZ78272.1 conserved hypothetical protein [Shewanella halifaxensis HAW-EB4]
MKTSWLITTMLLGLSGSPLAADQQPDPSDLTAVNSFVYGTVDNEGRLNGMLGMAGSFSEGNNYMGLVEHISDTKNNEFARKAQNSRLRYFQVLDTGNKLLPQAGFSVDYMKGWKTHSDDTSSDIVALGAITKLTTPWESFSLFPNIAVVRGSASQGNGSSFDLKGYQVNLFGSFSIGDSGQYVIVQPQFMQLDGKPSKNAKGEKLSGKVFKVKTGYGMPISDNGKWWTELSHTYTRTDAKINIIGTPIKALDNDHKFELGISYYF